MKESIEEKAKAYDEAIKKAESLYKVSEPMSGCNVIIETLFPELKENEDERIRKTLIIGFNKLDKSAVWYNGITNGQILNWLEKQGEQKSAWSEEDNRILSTLTKYLEEHGGGIDGWECSFLSKWLKSLRPQSQWKPSGFHLECISDAIAIYEEHGINAIGLKEILEELKKLK